MNVSSVKNLNGEVFSAVQDASLTNVVQSNSAQWGQGGGGSDTFYIYPGKTTDKEISENSGKDLKLYNSANNVFLDFAGKSTLQNYTMFSFKEITGTQSNQNTLQHFRLRVYPNATSACKVFDKNTVSLLNSNSTANYANTAQTAYYDAGGRDLAQTHDDLTALNQFVQSNSANWGGGSSPSVDNKVLFYKNYSYDPSYGSQNNESLVSGATELYFEAAADSQLGTPSEIVFYRNGNEIGRAYWTQVSSDGSNNYLTASYNNADGGDIQIQNYNNTNYNWCNVSANGVNTQSFNQGSYNCATDKEVKFNIIGSNIVGQIHGLLHGNGTQLTSFTGGLTDFTAKGYEEYDTFINSEDSNNSHNYNLSAEFGGSSIAGGNTEVSHDNSLSGNGTVESPLGLNRTTLFENASGTNGNTNIVLSESISNFEYVQIDYSVWDVEKVTQILPVQSFRYILNTDWCDNQQTTNYYHFCDVLTISGTSYTLIKAAFHNFNSTAVNVDGDAKNLFKTYKIVGINRISGSNA